jgi:hypothetical protein
MTVSADYTNFTLSAIGSGLNQKSQFYLKADNSPTYGFRNSTWEHSDFDYLIENNCLYIYTGTGRDWSWKSFSSVTMQRTNEQVTVVFPTSLLSDATEIQAAFISADSKDLIAPKIHDPLASCYVSNPVHVHTPGEFADCEHDQICLTCGEILVPALGHVSGEFAGCERDQVCLICGQVITPALGHTPGQPADCEHDQICLTCGEALVPALGHTPGQPADCEHDQVCLVCEKVLARAFKHTPGEPANYEHDQVCLTCGQILVPKPPRPTGPFVAKMAVTAENKNFTLSATGSGLNQKSQFYLRTDVAPKSAFKNSTWKESGFDYLIENNYLYIYTGTGSNWSWKSVASVTMVRTNDQVSIILPMSLLKNATEIQAAFMSADSKELIVPKTNEPLVPTLWDLGDGEDRVPLAPGFFADDFDYSDETIPESADKDNPPTSDSMTISTFIFILMLMGAAGIKISARKKRSLK